MSLLGEGGMGQVYRARDTRLERDVAALPHLNICTIHDVELARARAAAGDAAKARAAYADSLTLWKDADPEGAILKEAREESQSLK